MAKKVKTAKSDLARWEIFCRSKKYRLGLKWTSRPSFAVAALAVAMLMINVAIMSLLLANRHRQAPPMPPLTPTVISTSQNQIVNRSR